MGDCIKHFGYDKKLNLILMYFINKIKGSANTYEIRNCYSMIKENSLIFSSIKEYYCRVRIQTRGIIQQQLVSALTKIQIFYNIM